MCLDFVCVCFLCQRMFVMFYVCIRCIVDWALCYFVEILINSARNRLVN